MKTASAKLIPTKHESDATLELTAEFARARPLHEDFTRHLSDLLRTLLDAEGVEVHALESRTKSIDSFRGKVARPGKSYSTPLSEITDLTGIRIIAYYNDDVDAVSKVIEREFAVDRLNSADKRRSTQPHEFGYQSVHYVIRIGPKRARLTEWDRFGSLCAEIQVRTVLQHAWAAISHKLSYKRETDMPQPLSRKLFRLSALLELGDDEFSSLRDQTTALAQDVIARMAKGNGDISLDLISLTQYVRTAREFRPIFRFAKQAGFDTMGSLSKAEPESDTLTFLKALGLDEIGQLRAMVKNAQAWALSYFIDLINESGGWAGPPEFFLELIAVAHFRSTLSAERIVALGWDLRTVNWVINAAARIDMAPSGV